MSYQVEIRISLIRRVVFSIDDSRIIYGESEMLCRDIDGFSYGKSVTENRYVRITTYTVKLRSASGQKLEFAFTEALNSDGHRILNEIAEAIWKYAGYRIANEMIAAISRGRSISIGGINFNAEGFSYTRKPWFRKERTYHVAWHEIIAETNQRWDWLELKSSVDNKTHAIVGLVGVLNGHVLAYILTQLKHDPEMISYLTGNKVYLQQ